MALHAVGWLGECPALGPVTSSLFLRYRLQSFKVGAEVPNQTWHDVRHLIADSFSQPKGDRYVDP
jgi:hypothetical protein